VDTVINEYIANITHHTDAFKKQHYVCIVYRKYFVITPCVHNVIGFRSGLNSKKLNL
jgi:hypothetical protein